MYPIILWKDDSVCIFKLVKYLKLPLNKYNNEIALFLKMKGKGIQLWIHPILGFRLFKCTKYLYLPLCAIKWTENSVFKTTDYVEIGFTFKSYYSQVLLLIIT